MAEQKITSSSFDLLSKKDKTAITMMVNKLRATPDQSIPDLLNEFFSRTSFSDEGEMERYLNMRLDELKNNPAYSQILADIIEIQKFIFDDDSEYRIILANHSEFTLPAKDLIQKTKFDTAYLSSTNKVPLGDATSFKVFLARMLMDSNVKQIRKEREVDEMGEARDYILQFIESATIVDHIDKTQYSLDSVFEDRGFLYVQSNTIRRLLEKGHFECSMRKMRVLMDEYVRGSSVVLRLSNRLVRYWMFDLSKLHVKLHMKKVRDDDETKPETQTAG